MIFAKKSLGQNFVRDKNIIRKVINLVNIHDKDIIEIGPGNGALTDEIIRKKPKSLIIIEKDFLLAKNLQEKYFFNKNVHVYNSDILKFDIEKISKKNSTVFGNLPYNISSQILVKILNFKRWPPSIDNLVFMFQKELGEKIIGKFKTSNYGRLSILSNLRLNIKKKFYVSPNCFIPKPKVTSMVIHFQPKLKNSFKIRNIKNLEFVTNVFFSNKRKMINKSIKKILNEKSIKKIKNLNLHNRPSEVSPDLYYKITQLYEVK